MLALIAGLLGMHPQLGASRNNFGKNNESEIIPES